jgi:hypothetical protein
MVFFLQVQDLQEQHPLGQWMLWCFGGAKRIRLKFRRLKEFSKSFKCVRALRQRNTGR